MIYSISTTNTRPNEKMHKTSPICLSGLGLGLGLGKKNILLFPWETNIYIYCTIYTTKGGGGGGGGGGGLWRVLEK